MTVEALLTMFLIFGICLGGFILFLYLSSREN